MKLILLLGIAITAAATAHAAGKLIHADADVTFVVPSNSPAQYERTGEYGVLHYAGRFPLKGHYVYGYVTENPEEDVHFGELELEFTVSQSTAERLPYWTDGSPVREITIRNAERFARDVVGPANIAKLKAHRIERVSGTATIVVDQFETSVECDHQTSSARFVRAVLVPERVAEKRLASASGC